MGYDRHLTLGSCEMPSPLAVGSCLCNHSAAWPHATPCSGEEVSLIGDAWRILHELASDARWQDVQIAYVSRTDEPRECGGPDWVWCGVGLRLAGPVWFGWVWVLGWGCRARAAQLGAVLDEARWVVVHLLSNAC